MAMIGRVPRPRLPVPGGPARLRHHWEWLRTGYLLVPSLMVGLAMLLAWGAVGLDRYYYSSDAYDVSRWYVQGGPEEARTILGMIAGSMITIVGIVYSIAMVNLTLASDQFGPRLIRTFMTDLGTQVVLGAFLATFIYSILILMVVEAHVQAEPPPVPTAAEAVGAAAASGPTAAAPSPPARRRGPPRR